jgi:hypothetical protein
MIQPNPIPDRSLLPIKHIDSWEEWKINNQDVTPFLESSARGTRSSPQSGLHFEAVKYLNHNSRFDPLFAPTRKGGDARHEVFISISECKQTRQTTEKNEVNF